MCKLELWPGGDESKARPLGLIEISNTVSRSLETAGKRGTYRYRIYKKRVGKVVHEGTLSDFPRESYHPWNMVRRILDLASLKHGAV